MNAPVAEKRENTGYELLVRINVKLVKGDFLINIDYNKKRGVQVKKAMFGRKRKCQRKEKAEEEVRVVKDVREKCNVASADPSYPETKLNE